MNLPRNRRDRAGSFSGNTAERAIIDIGSNTVRMVVYGGTMRAPTTLLNEKVVAQLGREINSTGRLAQDSIDLAMRGLKRFALLLRELGVEDAETVATAASRDAENGPAFLGMVRELGFEPRLLAGEEEAKVSAQGVIGAFPGAAGCVADLGGGSLELVRILDGESEGATTFPLGTLRLREYREEGDEGALPMRQRLSKKLKGSGWSKGNFGPLYLVGGTWRAMAVYAMHIQNFPLSDPHALELTRKEVLSLARKLAREDAEKLKRIPRLTSMRAAILPDAAVLLQSLLRTLEPETVVFSSWGLREGLLYSRLEDHKRAQDPLLAGVSHFAASRGAPPQLATRIAGWTSSAVPTGIAGSERVRLAATMLALAGMQIEPNLRLHIGIDWALHKRWLAISAEERAMMAATLAANANELELPKELKKLAPPEALDEAINWGLGIRLARRIGARAPKSFQISRLLRDEDRLILRLQESHQDLYGVPVEKDLKLLSDRFNLVPVVEIVPEDAVWESEPDDLLDAAQ